MKHTLSILVENKPGVLTRVAGLFARRAFNIESLAVGLSEDPRLSCITIVIARFMPFVRTFAPFVAGVAQMTRRKFTFFDVTGGALWVGGIVTAGYFFGNVPWVKHNLEKIIWGMILVPGVLALLGAWKARRRQPT